MKKILFYSVMAVALLLSAVSCSKPLSEQIVGHYHFKMSGYMKCDCANYDSLGHPVCYYLDERFLLKAQTGTMNIIKMDGDEYIVNMSVAMFGDEMSFSATLEDDVLSLEKQGVVVRVGREGISGTSNSQSVFVELSGSGKLYDGTLMFQMIPSGEFYSTFDNLDWKCSVTSEHDIICVADRI